MKAFEVSHKIQNKMVSVLKYTKTKLHSGMIFKITGDTELKGIYVVTGQGKAPCKDCPLSVPNAYMPSFSTCGLLKPSKGGYNYSFCTKDLRGHEIEDNAFTLKKLDTIMEDL